METIKAEHRLRNHRDRLYQIEASGEGSGTEGSTVRATVTTPEGKTFRVEVRFDGPWTSTKGNFDAHMYLETAMSVIQAHIESRLEVDTRIRVHQASGLMKSETGVAAGA